MSSTITASGIPKTASDAKIEEFFSFCGKIQSISVVDSNEKTKTVKVEFVSASAVSTALLLNGAELEGGSIKVIEEGLSKQPVLPAYSEKDENATSTTTQPTQTEAGTETPHSDIPQEEKPKSTILAEYLAHGYVLSDNLVQKAVEFDQKNGVSSKFTNFLNNLDSKYHLQSKNQQLFEQANSQFGPKIAKGRSKLDSYFDRFKSDKYGSKIHQFYSGVATDAKQVHEEAKRLAELKKAEAAGTSSSAGATGTAGATTGDSVSTSAPNTATGEGSAAFPAISSITPDSTTAQAAGATAFEADKK